MQIQQDHRSRKRSSYWQNLVEGATALYKVETLDTLIDHYAPQPKTAILDIGCGTSVLANTLRSRSPGCRLMCMDYDPVVVARMRAASDDPTIEWRVADILDLAGTTDRFDLVLLIDMLHEVYSFYGRSEGAGIGIIDHHRGLAVVEMALAEIARIVSPGGAIAITDNVLSDAAGPYLVRLRQPDRLAPVIAQFIAEYPSRRIAPVWVAGDTFEIGSSDFCILLTRSNKLKSGQIDRWNVEKLEVHQYFDRAGYQRLFDSLGFDMHATVGTPSEALAEWAEDFDVLAGGSGLPDKRISLLAVKR